MSNDLRATASTADAAAAGSAELACLVALASQAWRLSRLSKRAIEKLHEPEAARLASQVRYIDRQMEDELHRAGLRVVDLDGERFDPGMAATALNAEDFQSHDNLWVAQTLEPVIMGPSGLLKYGVVMLAKAQQ